MFKAFSPSFSHVSAVASQEDVLFYQISQWETWSLRQM